MNPLMVLLTTCTLASDTSPDQAYHFPWRSISLLPQGHSVVYVPLNNYNKHPYKGYQIYH